jgi:hypothetical protein
MHHILCYVALGRHAQHHARPRKDRCSKTLENCADTDLARE